MTKHLHRARKAKNDEFYTQLTDIEKEISHYAPHFRGKVVYCNCDDPSMSKFFHYFSHNFEHLGLKKLVTTCYKNQHRDLFSENKDERDVMLDYDGIRSGERVPKAKDIGVKVLNGDGDLRSGECIDILKRVDIVVTNPPFSLFRDYVFQLIEYGKEFLIIGSQNAISYKEIFPLIMGNEMWLGINPGGQEMLFDVSVDYAKELLANATEGSAYKVIDGVVKGRLGNACWFTNLGHQRRQEKLLLYRGYTPEEHLKYDNYDAINVDKIRDIPMDYAGVIGVPITFLSKHNPDQFEIIGITKTWFNAAAKIYPTQVQVSPSGRQIEVKKLNDGATFKIDGPIAKTYYIVDGNYYVQAYVRILVRNRKPQL